MLLKGISYLLYFKSFIFLILGSRQTLGPTSSLVLSYFKSTRHAIHVTCRDPSYPPKTHSIIPNWSYQLNHTHQLTMKIFILHAAYTTLRLRTTMATHGLPTMGGIAEIAIAALPDTDCSPAIPDIPSQLLPIWLQGKHRSNSKCCFVGVMVCWQ